MLRQEQVDATRHAPHNQRLKSVLARVGCTPAHGAGGVLLRHRDTEQLEILEERSQSWVLSGEPACKSGGGAARQLQADTAAVRERHGKDLDVRHVDAGISSRHGDKTQAFTVGHRVGIGRNHKVDDCLLFRRHYRDGVDLKCARLLLVAT